ncbi:MAG: HAMP domain-containing histidine kinase [Ilumatobacteraceae bacterium]|jgi:two-component system sensor histidine kinase BaeS|nr:HAMP domain-containing histidine kinase [Acidimicrobiaceae bacterium]MBP6487502.1 HAMP domain-containing histidine kinase [Ilumatobacteraceae bacterium]MBP7887666.1 HAMP domain-containing histidine kinase [Ilumatobacteraceae bacterium]MBP8207940.1 HAMP domain-containing histidine kinase [Ilumatobacteraceae bacterium]MBP9051202.1 HAMP domain-containing histidine kinase [Ilumatobacteraceae bacterium]
MTRRLALVIVGVVVATLLLAGAGTLLLSAARARSTTVKELRAQAVEMAGNIGQVLEIDESLSAAEQAKQLRNRLRLLGTLRRVVALDDISVLIVGPDGEVQGELPTALSIADLQLDVLATGQSIADNRGKLAFAAAPAAGPAGRQYIVVVSRRIDAGLGPAFVLFIWASGATILLALGAAYLLGRRLTRPIREASTATQHIAAGQLSTRITEPPAHHHDELAELSRNVNAMAASLERSRGLEQQFLLSVTHDLRTPLTSIRGYAEAIDDGNVDPKRAAAVIRAESARLERLVTDLLELAKLQARAFTFTMAPVDLSAAAHTVTAAAAGSKPGITFHPVTTGPLLVQADPDRLAQALANLVENAGKYATSAVMVSTRAEGRWAVLTVDDDGPGIAPHDQPHVFERLYVARHEPERRENSSGLGLAIVRELVTGMGGEVAADSAPNGGARLSIRLPLSG